MQPLQDAQCAQRFTDGMPFGLTLAAFGEEFQPRMDCPFRSGNVRRQLCWIAL
jgi:hypothetical protein